VIFVEAMLAGAYIIESEPVEDERGSFARTFCRREFEAHGLNPTVAQCSMSCTRRRGTLRGLHFQEGRYAEDKLVRCVRGAIHDVIVDLRPTSPTFTRHFAVELTDANGRALYVPQGCAHGFQSLQDDCLVAYQMSEFYEPAASRGVRWNDPAFGIAWPIEGPILNQRDASFPDLDPRSLR
jgi:dTDP-4-dehydrorhamnose 3,5-epimerase